MEQNGISEATPLSHTRAGKVFTQSGTILGEIFFKIIYFILFIIDIK